MTPTPEFETIEDEVTYLRAQVAKLEENREKLLDSLRIKQEKESENFVYLPESSLTNFDHYDKCDQKLLAILYWEKLTDKQKEVFTDWQEMELQKDYERRLNEIMTDPTKMRQHFLKNASPVLDSIIKLANGDKKLTGDNYAFREVWEILKGIISSANNPAPMMDLRGKDVSQQIDEILTQVSTGKINFDEAKEYMSLVSSGFNLQELPKLMAKLDALENMS
jgi:polyhydroxyalkanoate synthesis regulator phasin